ncbi:hypothetical protein M0805_002015 [Coniferiporia weirii]|nr:hypothetical protein M0805_002015 [Coniferiporia weirii]
MKLTDDMIPALLIPLLGLQGNDSGLANFPRHSGDTNISFPSSIHATGATPVATDQALFTHSSHHPQHLRDFENPYEIIAVDEEDNQHLLAGQRQIKVHIHSTLEEANECPNPPIVSCSSKAEQTDSCCVVNPGGILVHTQFWDLQFGEANSWGIHGLWPDKCSGSYYENCDSSRKYTGEQITQTLGNAGQSSLVDYMNEYWVSNDESPADFWAHEWATHGTCVSTLEPQCFTGYTTAQEVVPYFQIVVQLFKKFDTYKALTDAGITPSSSNTYTLAELQSAVSTSLGYSPDFTCESGELSTVQYYLNAQGPLQDGVFVPSRPSRKSDCPTTGIKWLPKTVGTTSA